MSRADQYRVSVSINGEDTGVWDKMTGGNVDSEETKYKQGGIVPPISLGGSQTPENVTVSRLYVLERDHQRVKDWGQLAGRADVVITKQPLDVNGTAFGQPLVYRGKLKAVNPPEVDSESSDAAMLEIEVSTAGAFV